MNNVDHLDRIKAKFEYIRTIRNLNNTQQVFRIPKYLFIKNILIFLEDEDITSIANSCKVFNVIVYNSFTYRVLLATRGMKATAEAIAFQALHMNQALQKDLESLYSKDVRAQLSAFTTLKDFLTEKAKVLEDVLSNSEKEASELKKQLANERQQKQKNLETLHSLEQHLDTKITLYALEKQDHGETVKELNNHYHNMLAKKEREFQEVEEKRKKLQNDKEALILEMNKIQEENQRIIDMNEQYKDVLNKMRQMFGVNTQGQMQKLLQSQDNIDTVNTLNNI